jgi:uncharacterized protein YjbJ (UPF0337 family)
VQPLNAAGIEEGHGTSAKAAEKFIPTAGTPLAASSTSRRKSHFWRMVMNKDQVKGVAEKAKGKVNEVAGKATGNVGREMKGDIQQGMGQARKDMGDMREDAKDAAKHPAKRSH